VIPVQAWVSIPVSSAPSATPQRKKILIIKFRFRLPPDECLNLSTASCLIHPKVNKRNAIHLAEEKNPLG
jgi:hypothetical protein